LNGNGAVIQKPDVLGKSKSLFEISMKSLNKKNCPRNTINNSWQKSCRPVLLTVKNVTSKLQKFKRLRENWKEGECRKK